MDDILLDVCRVPVGRRPSTHEQDADRPADLVVAVECVYSWYWLADLCASYQEAIVGAGIGCNPNAAAVRTGIAGGHQQVAALANAEIAFQTHLGGPVGEHRAEHAGHVREPAEVLPVAILDRIAPRHRQAG